MKALTKFVVKFNTVTATLNPWYLGIFMEVFVILCLTALFVMQNIIYFTYLNDSKINIGYVFINNTFSDIITVSGIAIFFYCIRKYIAELTKLLG